MYVVSCHAVRGPKGSAPSASREALRRATALYRQSAFSSTRPASRGICCATAVNAANLLSPEHPVRHRRTVRGQKAAPLPASREALRRATALYRQSAGSRTRPASREARRRAAVASRPSCMFHEQPRALWARCGVQGVTPCLEEDADHAAVAFVDDLAEGLLHFFLSVHGHAHQLVGKALPYQLVQAFAEEVRVPDGLGVVLELLQ